MAEVKDGKLKLSAAERRAFFAREWPEIAGKGVPPAHLRGTRHALSSRLWFTVRTVHRTRLGWRLDYDVTDDREERFHLLPAAASFRTDERGDLVDMPPEEEIGYTRNPKRRTVDELPSVPPRIQNVLDVRARLTDAQRGERDDEMFERQAKNFSAELRGIGRRCIHAGIDPGPHMAELLSKLKAELEESEQEAA